MSSSCTECKGQIVWNLDGIVCCSKCGVVMEDEVFEEISTTRKSRDYDSEQFEHTYLPDFQRAMYRRLKRRERGLKDFDKILDSLRTSEELSANLKIRLLHPRIRLLFDFSDQEIESLCKAGGKFCHQTITFAKDILAYEFWKRYKSLHKTKWIHSRTMEDAAFLILNRLLVEKLDEHKTKAFILSSLDMGGDSPIFQKLAIIFLKISFLGALIDAIEDKYSNKIELLEKRDSPYFMERDAQKIKKELLKKHPELKIEVIRYSPKRIDPALSKIRKGDLLKLFRMPYFKDEKPVDMLKCVENEVRIEARRRFRSFLSSLRVEDLKHCKKTGLYAACCYLETYLHEFNNSQILSPLYEHCLKRGYKSEILIRPVSQKDWAKAFGITRQTLINRINELGKNDHSIKIKLHYVRSELV